MFKFVLPQVARTKSMSSNNFNSFKSMTVIHRIGSWCYEVRTASLNVKKLIELHRPGSNLLRLEMVEGKKEFLKKKMLCLEDDNVV